MGKTEEEKFEERLAEIRRYYLQEKSTRAECGYGTKNCSTCQNTDCKIRQYLGY